MAIQMSSVLRIDTVAADRSPCRRLSVRQCSVASVLTVPRALDPLAGGDLFVLCRRWGTLRSASGRCCPLRAICAVHGGRKARTADAGPQSGPATPEGQFIAPRLRSSVLSFISRSVD